MHAHIQILAAGVRCKLERTLDGGAGVLRVGADENDLADVACIDAALGLCVGIIKAAHEAEHEHLVRMSFHSLFCQLALFNRRVERLVAEAVLACIQCELDVLGMEHGGRNNNDRIQIRVLDHLSYVRVGVGNVQLLGYLCYALCVRVADGGQLCAGDIVCDILCVLIAQTTQTDRTDF